MYCPDCGSQLSEADLYCAKCGRKRHASESSASPPVTRPKNSRWAIAGAVVGFLLISAVVRAVVSNLNSPTPSTPSLINQTVQDIKSTVPFPTKLDEVTIWNDVSAEPNAIRYHYTLSGADTSSVTSASLKEYLRPQVCANEQTKSVLDQDIGMEYAYIVAGSTDAYLVSLTKADCP